MSWTYFTSYLTGSRTITKNERDELYTQLAAKFTGCAAMFSLNATQQAAITGSLLLTDRAGLDNSDDSSNTLGNLSEIIDSTSAVWDDFATAKATALSAEGISSSDLTAILSARMESYHLWNYYKRIIELLECPMPCTAPDPTIVRRTSSASLTKCGFPENDGHESSPPKIYLTKTLSGIAKTTEFPAFYCLTDCERTDTYTYSGYNYYPRGSCDIVDVACHFHYVITDCVTETGSGDDGGCSIDNKPLNATGPFTTTATTRSWHGDGCVNYPGSGRSVLTETGAALGGSDPTETLSDEYSTAMLDSDVTAALPAFSGSYASGTPSATYDISSDELTISKSKAQYKFTLPTLTEGQCYKISWIERFTPEGGGSPVDTAKSYLWNGSDTETPVYTLNVPGSQGTTTIVSIVASCDCS